MDVRTHRCVGSVLPTCELRHRQRNDPYILRASHRRPGRPIGPCTQHCVFQCTEPNTALFVSSSHAVMESSVSDR